MPEVNVVLRVASDILSGFAARDRAASGTALLIHRGTVTLDGVERGATLTIERDEISLEIVGPGGPHRSPDWIDVLLFTSSSGYFTLLRLDRRNHSMRFGVGSLTKYRGWLAFEGVVFETEEDVRSTKWSMHVGDVAKIIHVNGVRSDPPTDPTDPRIASWTVVPPDPVDLPCTASGLTVRFFQTISISGDAIKGPNLTLRYPVEIEFEAEVGPLQALEAMHRVRNLLSMVMGRTLPIEAASVTVDIDGRSNEMTVHGVRATETTERPLFPIMPAVNPAILGRLLDAWLTRYVELEDAIRLHTSGLLQRKLPTELKFQIYVQAIEALHRRTATSGTPIAVAPVLGALRGAGIPEDIVDRVGGVLAHAHEPGLRQRLRELWDLLAAEIEAMRPELQRKEFVNRVVATRNHYAHRTDINSQVLTGLDLWNATEMIKAISHLALLLEIGADVTGMGKLMLDRSFAVFGEAA